VTTSFQWTLLSPYRPSTLALIAGATLGGLRKVARAFQHRREAVTLARMDDRMLADIGLTRSDLRDAYGQPLWTDPTTILAARAKERRSNRHDGAGRQPANVVSPALVPGPGFSLPRTDRPARYTL